MKSKIFFCRFTIAALTNIIISPLLFANPSSNWSGTYLGGIFGAGSTTNYWTYTNRNYFNTSGSVLLGTDANASTSGVIGGANVGFNFQKKNLVWGLNGSVLGSDFDTTEADHIMAKLPGDLGSFFNVNYSLNVLTSIKALLGYTHNHWLTYINAGWAGGDVSMNLSDLVDGGLGANAASLNQWANGWAAGLGAAYKITQQLSLGASYNFVQLIFNNQTFTCPLCGNGDIPGTGVPVANGHINIQIVTMQLNYFFNKK